MSTLELPRELSYGAVTHPDHLAFRRPRGVLTLHRVEDVFTDAIVKGDPVLGWDGDARLAVYLSMPQPECAEASYWVVRLCADGTYQTVLRHPAVLRGPEIMAAFVRRLVEIDGRRGFDPIADLDKAEEQVAKAREDARAEQVAEVADRLHHAMRKDGLHNFVTGAG